MTGCSAFNCHNNSSKYQLFRIKRSVQKQWVQNLRRADWSTNPPKDYSNCKVCEVSIPTSDYFML